MTVIELEDCYGNTLCTIQSEQKISIWNCKGCDIADEDIDDIFSTNDNKIRIQLNNTMMINDIANSIVDDIVSCRQGEIYDEEILTMFTDDYFAYKIEEIKDLVDDKMKKYLENDNITIKEL